MPSSKFESVVDDWSYSTYYTQYIQYNSFSFIHDHYIPSKSGVLTPSELRSIRVEREIFYFVVPWFKFLVNSKVFLINNCESLSLVNRHNTDTTNIYGSILGDLESTECCWKVR